jgi:uroporphyrinogen-III synthase
MGSEVDVSSTQGAADGPLAGWRILVSRAQKQAATLSDSLRGLGAEILEIPFIEVRPPRSYKVMDESLALIGEYEWLILTSVNGVESFFSRLKKLNMPRRVLHKIRIAAIGPATRAAIEQQGLRVEVMPRKYVAEAVVEALTPRIKGQRVLLFRAKDARDVIPHELRLAGAFVDVVEAYSTVVPQSSRVSLRAALHDPCRRPHLITFTSSSTVKSYVTLLAIHSGKSKLVAGILNASIGPVTSQTLRGYELGVDAEAANYTIPGLVEAIVERAKRGLPEIAEM